MWSEQGSAENCHLHYKCVIMVAWCFDVHVEKNQTTSSVLKDTGTKFEPHVTFAMLNYFSTNQYGEP